MAYTSVPVIDAAVVGGGAAGMMAAAAAAERGLKVTLFEPNRTLGKKLRITGKGRCNLTNACSAREVLENTPRNGRFLHSALSRFSPDDAIAFFEGLGVGTKLERGRRVFPVSDRASDVADALENLTRRLGVTVRREAVREIITEGGGVSAVRTESAKTACRAVILCTGGLSYPATGSTGDGYRMAAELGHSVVTPRASLVPLESGDGFCRSLQGLSLKNVRLRAFDSGGAERFCEMGEMLFTHFGVSGPLVLSASSRLTETAGSRLSVDLKPALDEGALDARILRDFEKNKNRELKNSLFELAPRLLVPVLIERSGIAPETRVNAITRGMRRALAAVFKDFRIDIKGPRPIDEAIITSGGVSTPEINPRTMGSKLVAGLYFAGELIDADAYTGGFNLQIAWSTARLAGQSVLSGGND